MTRGEKLLGVANLIGFALVLLCCVFAPSAKLSKRIDALEARLAQAPRFQLECDTNGTFRLAVIASQSNLHSVFLHVASWDTDTNHYTNIAAP